MMTRVFVSLLSLAMIGCLTAYAIGHVSTGGANVKEDTQRIAAPVNGPNGGPLRAMRPMADTELAAADQERARQRQESLNRELAEREVEIIAQLGLDQEQMVQYEALRDETMRQGDALREFDGDRIARGMEINQELHRGLREIFSAEQYEIYRRLWSEPRQAGPGAKSADCADQDDVARLVNEEAQAGDNHPW